jgi:hypothetical protein
MEKADVTNIGGDISVKLLPSNQIIEHWLTAVKNKWNLNYHLITKKGLTNVLIVPFSKNHYEHKNYFTWLHYSASKQNKLHNRQAIKRNVPMQIICPSRLKIVWWMAKYTFLQNTKSEKSYLVHAVFVWLTKINFSK